jgi:hypothetical protein
LYDITYSTVCFLTVDLSAIIIEEHLQQMNMKDSAVCKIAKKKSILKI